MKRRAIILSIPTFLSLTLLNGCTPYAESFDCPPGFGVGCKSLSRVNQMVEEGELPLEDSSSKITPSQRVPSKRVPARKPTKGFDAKGSNSLIEAKNEKGPINILPNNITLETRPDTGLKIWFAAYEDEDGIYHAPSYVYASLKNHPAEQMEVGK